MVGGPQHLRWLHTHAPQPQSGARFRLARRIWTDREARQMKNALQCAGSPQLCPRCPSATTHTRSNRTRGLDSGWAGKYFQRGARASWLEMGSRCPLHASFRPRRLIGIHCSTRLCPQAPCGSPRSRKHTIAKKYALIYAQTHA